MKDEEKDDAQADAAERPLPHLIGWRCPVCGGGVSPYANRCPCQPAMAPPVLTPQKFPISGGCGSWDPCPRG